MAGKDRGLIARSLARLCWCQAGRVSLREGNNLRKELVALKVK